jgi:hypothetical protein
MRPMRACLTKLAQLISYDQKKTIEKARRQLIPEEWNDAMIKMNHCYKRTKDVRESMSRSTLATNVSDMMGDR